MDKREAIRLFIKRNSNMFRTEPFPADLFKRIKRDFFIQFAKVPVPKDSDIGEELVEMMINRNQINTEDQLEKLFQVEFFSKNIPNKDYYYQKLRIRAEQVQTLIDIPAINREDYERKLKDDAKKEILNKLDEDLRQREEAKKQDLFKLDEDLRKKEEESKQVLSKMDEEIKRREEQLRAKEEEYRKFPSILDISVQEVPEGESDENEVLQSEYTLWWKALGLTDDPFPILEGIGTISDDLESVIYKTPIFEKYDSIIGNAPSELYKNTVFYGDFGSGKTTLFDYLRIKVGLRNIVPIYIQLYGAFDVHGLLISFRTKLLDELIQNYKIIVKTGQSYTSTDTDIENSIMNLMNELTTKYGVEGFVIFIDELHKGDLDTAMKFISLLQTFKAEIIRKYRSVNVGFMITGSLEWEKRISNDPLYSGSVTKQETMPPITIDAAHQALNLRLKTFSSNPVTPRRIDKNFVEKVYKGLEVNGLPLNFRSIIRSVINEFEAGHFEALTVNPIEIPSGILIQIKNMFESNTIANLRLAKLLHGPRDMNSHQKTMCLKYLIQVHRSNGIYDTEIKPDEAAYFKRLDQAILIVKTVKNNQLYWVVASAIDNVNNQVIHKFNLSLGDYLLKIYGDEETLKQPKQEIGEIVTVDEFLKILPKSTFFDLLQRARDSYLEIVREFNTKPSFEKAVPILNKSYDSLTTLTKSYLVFEQYPSSDTYNFMSFWKHFWFSPEQIEQYLRIINHDESEIEKFYPLALNLYRDSFIAIFNFINQQYDKSRQIRIPLRMLKNEEIAEFNEIRDDFIAMEYFKAAAKTSKLVEKKLRNFLFNVFTILYGERDQRLKRLYKDQKTLNYITDNIANAIKTGFGDTRNEFQHLNRGQYKNLMTGTKGNGTGRDFWLHIFSTVFAPWSENDLYEYLDLFAEINKNVSHNKEDSIQVDQHNLVYRFIVNSIEFLKKTNGMYVKILSKDCVKRNGSSILFSLCQFHDGNDLTACQILTDDAKRIVDFIGNKNMIVPFDDQEFIRQYFSIDYRNFIALIAILANQETYEVERTKTKLEINPDRNPDIILNMINLI